MTRRRRNGEGSIYRRSVNGPWMGAITIGYNDQGNPIRKTVSAKTYSETVKRLRDLQRQIDDGLPAPNAVMSVAQLFALWFSEALPYQVSVNTLENYKSVADHHIMPSIGHRKVASLTSLDVDRLLHSKSEYGLSGSTVQRIRFVLAQMIDQGIRWGFVNRNVATLARAPISIPKEGRTLSPVDARRSAVDDSDTFFDQDLMQTTSQIGICPGSQSTDDRNLRAESGEELALL
jgi:integrase